MTDKIAIAKGPKNEVSIWPILIIIIAGKRSAINARFTIDSISVAGLFFITKIGTSITGVIKDKIREIFTKARAGGARNANNKA